MGKNKAAQRQKKKAVAADGAEEVKESNKDKGNRAFLANEFDKALEFYNAAIQEDEKDHTLYSNRSATHLAMKNPAQALADADKVLALKSDWPKGYLRRADALEALLRYPEAHSAYQKGLELAPDDKSLLANFANLQKLLEELKMTEQQLSAHENPEADKFEVMVNWMKEGGCQFPMLYMQYYSEDYRGVHSLTKIAPNKVILYVPLSHIMTSEVAKASDIGKKISDTIGEQLRSKHSFLAAYLLQERLKGKQSFWYPYINMLPVKYRNMPIFFTKEELDLLKGSFTLEKIEDRKESLRKEYEAICTAVPEFRRHTLHEFVWARLVVITRIFGLEIKGKKTDGLVPYADMLNHKRELPEGHGGDVKPRETKWTFDDEVSGFTITSLKTIQRGEEVYDSYGRKCNSRFFVNYGFALEDNEDNEVVLRFALPKDDPQYGMKVRFLGGERSAQREFQVPASYREKKTKELFSFLRFVHAREQEIVLLPSDPSKIDEIEPLSIRNEIAVLKHVKQSAELVLSGFPDTWEHDEKWLKEDVKRDPNVRSCVLMRHGEKTVCKWFINLAEECIPMLNMPWKDLKRQAAKCYPEKTALDFYVTNVVAHLAKKQA